MPSEVAQSELDGFHDPDDTATDLVNLLESRWFGLDSSPTFESLSQAVQPTDFAQNASVDNKANVQSKRGSSGMSLNFPCPSAAARRNSDEASIKAGQRSTKQSQQQHQNGSQRQYQLHSNQQHHKPPVASMGHEVRAGSSAFTTISASSTQPQAEDLGPLPLGTWANRQRFFLQQQAGSACMDSSSTPISLEPRNLVENAGQAGASSSVTVGAHNVPSCNARQQLTEQGMNKAEEHGELQSHAVIRPHHSTSSTQEEEDELNAAWRWRFARKWQTEQAKQFDPEYGKEGGDDEWGDALGYMDALATHGLNLQIGRTMSTDQHASLSMLSSTLSQSMLLDASIKESPLTSTMEEASLNATQHIVAVARRAQQLLKQQQEIERQVEQRWECASSGQPWVGQHLPAVTIDSWGRFSFVLVRVLDRSSRHKVLVRGKNGTEEGGLWTQLEQEVSRAAVQHRLPGPRLELLGSGIMEWSRDRDRTLNILAGKLKAKTDARLKSKLDVSKLAGALALSSLPVTYKILVEGRTPDT